MPVYKFSVGGLSVEDISQGCYVMYSEGSESDLYFFDLGVKKCFNPTFIVHKSTFAVQFINATSLLGAFWHSQSHPNSLVPGTLPPDSNSGSYHPQIPESLSFKQTPLCGMRGGGGFTARRGKRDLVTVTVRCE